VEVHVKVCFESGATLETAGTGILLTNAGPWTLLTAAHVVDERQWEAVRNVDVTVRRQGSFASGFQPAKVTRLNRDADIAELEVELDPGVEWQAATAPAERAPTVEEGDSVAFLCFFEKEIRRGVVISKVERAGGVPTYELDIGSGFGCSGAGALTADGRLAGILIQANQDVTRISSIATIE
jgi:hypothetical protein